MEVKASTDNIRLYNAIMGYKTRHEQKIVLLIIPTLMCGYDN